MDERFLVVCQTPANVVGGLVAADARSLFLCYYMQTAGVDYAVTYDEDTVEAHVIHQSRRRGNSKGAWQTVQKVTFVDAVAFVSSKPVTGTLQDAMLTAVLLDLRMYTDAWWFCGGNKRAMLDLWNRSKSFGSKMLQDFKYATNMAKARHERAQERFDTFVGAYQNLQTRVAELFHALADLVASQKLTVEHEMFVWSHLVLIEHSADALPDNSVWFELQKHASLMRLLQRDTKQLITDWPYSRSVWMHMEDCKSTATWCGRAKQIVETLSSLVKMPVIKSPNVDPTAVLSVALGATAMLAFAWRRGMIQL